MHSDVISFQNLQTHNSVLAICKGLMVLKLILHIINSFMTRIYCTIYYSFDSASVTGLIHVVVFKIFWKFWNQCFEFLGSLGEMFLLLWFVSYRNYHNNHLYERLKEIPEEIFLCCCKVTPISKDTFFNFISRKQYVLDGVVDFEEELKFTQLILSKHPKSCESFSQR